VNGKALDPAYSDLLYLRSARNQVKYHAKVLQLAYVFIPLARPNVNF